MSPMTNASSGRVRTSPIQNRRAMSTSSGSGPSTALTVRGSSAMPQIGHDPGASRTICGCIGHVHSVRGPEGASGSSAMPHFGQLPGPRWRISGCIGHVYMLSATGGAPSAITLHT
jgi:hypothetical protein